MKKWTAIFALVTMGFSLSSQAMVFMKCNTLEGKTLWGSFGKRVTSGEAPVFFPTELTIFSSKTTLQERLIFQSSREAIEKVKVRVAGNAITMDFESKDANGAPLMESILLRLYRQPSAFSGMWTSSPPNGVGLAQQVACSVY